MSERYIEVIARFLSQEDARERAIVPLSIYWKDGREFPIDRVIDARPAASLRAGGYGIRFTVLIDGKQRFLWLEEGNERWFVEI